MDLKHALVISAVAGMFGGATACGGNAPPAADPSQGAAPQSSAKASCSGPDHTDKNHCSASTGAAPAPPK